MTENVVADGSCRLTPVFLPASSGEIFCLYISPAPPVKPTAAFLHLAAFAEEMNKSRQMVSQQARKLAKYGIATLIVDNFGTGESDGELADASWEGWIADIDVAAGWLAQSGIEEISLWGNRLGAALAVEYAQRGMIRIHNLVLWQPVLHGSNFLKQFFRLRKAAELFGASADANSESKADRLNVENEVAGYVISEELQESIAAVRADHKSPGCDRVAIFEVNALQPLKLSPLMQRLSNSWCDSGAQVTSTAIPGEPYWSTTEIVINEELMRATVKYILNEN